MKKNENLEQPAAKAKRGRKKGVPNKNTREIKDFSKGFLERPAYRKSLKRRVDAGEAPHMETLLHHYGYGKPKESLDVNVNAAAKDMTDEELAAKAISLAQALVVRAIPG